MPQVSLPTLIAFQLSTGPPTRTSVCDGVAVPSPTKLPRQCSEPFCLIAHSVFCATTSVAQSASVPSWVCAVCSVLVTASNPQHHSVWSDLIAQVSPVAPIGPKKLAAATCSHTPGIGVAGGVTTGVPGLAAPVPSWPLRLLPQQNTAPSLRSAQ